MNVINTITNGGMLAGKRTYLISAAGILAAIGAYLAGDAGLAETVNAVFPLAAICFLRKGINNDK